MGCRDSLRFSLIATRFAESFGVKPQVAHSVALAPSVPTVRETALANELFATWAFPSLSAPFHQERITAVRPSATKLKFDFKSTLFAMRVATKDGSGLMERSEKPGSDPIFGDGISPA